MVPGTHYYPPFHFLFPNLVFLLIAVIVVLTIHWLRPLKWPLALGIATALFIGMGIAFSCGPVTTTVVTFSVPSSK